MKKAYKFIGFVVLGVAITTATSVVLKVRKRRAAQRLEYAANEGYETAHDINFPGSHLQKGDLKYGPVI